MIIFASFSLSFENPFHLLYLKPTFGRPAFMLVPLPFLFLAELSYCLLLQAGAVFCDLIIESMLTCERDTIVSLWRLAVLKSVDKT